MNNFRKAIVIGGNHHNTLGVIRSLGRKGIRPFVILTTKNPNPFVLKSKYIQDGRIVNTSEQAIDLMLSDFTVNDEKPVVFACHDVISSLLDVNRDKLTSLFVIPGCEKPGRVTTIMNKMVMGDIAHDVGLNIPKSFIVNDKNLSEQLCDYPCIVKPVESRLGAKTEIHVFRSAEQLHGFLNSKSGKSFLVQQYIEKETEFQLIGCSLLSGKEIIIPGVSIILRQPQTTNTGFLHYTSLDKSYNVTLENTKRFIKEIGYSGLFSVEYLRDKSGVDYFMEINFRNDGNSICVTNSGVNLPYIWYLGCNGGDFRSEVLPIHEEYVMPEFAELDLLAKGKISFRQWKSDMNKATSYMDYAEDDPSPTEGWKRYRRERIIAVFKHLYSYLRNSENISIVSRH